MAELGRRLTWDSLLSLIRSWLNRLGIAAPQAPREAGRSPIAQVVIGTTLGPVRIQNVSFADGAMQSVMCINGQAVETRVSRNYHLFVARGTGVIESRYGRGPYRMDVSGEIDTGSSWQLGAVAAHALHKADRLANDFENSSAQTPKIVWTTGAVRAADLAIQRVEAVPEKLQRSLQFLCEHTSQGRKVLILLPDENLKEVPPALRDTFKKHHFELEALRSVEQLEAMLGKPRKGRQRRWPSLPLRALGATAVLALLIYPLLLHQPAFDPLGIGKQPSIRPSFTRDSYTCVDYLRLNPQKNSIHRRPVSDLLCADQELATVDREMGEAYDQLSHRLIALEERENLMKTQRAWLDQRDRLCEINWDSIMSSARARNLRCVMNETIVRRNAYRERIREFRK